MKSSRYLLLKLPGIFAEFAFTFLMKKIFQLSELLFKAAKTNPSELDSIAVSEGPGSFTGLRIGFSAAKGIAYGANLPILPVPTYEAFALQLSFVLKENDE